MKEATVAVMAGLLLLAAESTASAQLIAAKDGPVVYGHHHLNVTDIDEHRKFWADALGGKFMTAGSMAFVKFPNVLVFLMQRPPTGGTKGTTVNHVGFQVPNIRQTVDHLKAAGYPIVTRAELPATQEVKEDLAYIADQNTYVAFVMGPDNVKVELVENTAATVPIALHHVHFATTQVEAMKAWYVKVFGAKPGKRGSFEAADLPGVNLTYSPSTDPVVATRGRALDHIGFEVKNLEAFCKRLEGMGITFDRPYSPASSLKLALAFLTDPFGTYIELTEGLDNY